MSKQLTSILATVVLAFSMNAQAKTETAQPKKTGTYFGLGAAKVDIKDNEALKSFFGTEFGIAGSIGKTYSLANNIYLDGKLSYSSSQNKLNATKCSSLSIKNINCDEVAVTSVFSLPVTVNYKVPFTSDFAVNAGVGGSVNYISRSFELQASNFQSSTEDSRDKFGFSPAVQAGISFGKFRLLAEQHFGLGDNEVGEGDMTVIQLQYGSQSNW